MMYSTIAHELLADAGPVSEPRLAPLPCNSASLYTGHGVTWCGPFGQLRSPVLAMLPLIEFLGFFCGPPQCQSRRAKKKKSSVYYELNL